MAAAVTAGPVPSGAPEPPEITAAAAIVIDSRNGRALWAKNSQRRLPIASLTKMMTAYLAISNGDLSTVVTISKKAASTGGATAGLSRGDRVSLRDLVSAVLIYSANDAATAVAEAVDVAADSFVAAMNARAESWNADNTHYSNPHGLPATDHYSTVRDQARIARRVMESAVFCELAATDSFTLQIRNRRGDIVASRRFRNRNRLLSEWEPCDGIKTGYTSNAGECLAASATANDWQPIAVVLHSDARFKDAKRLLNWAFETYRVQKVVDRQRNNWILPVEDGEPKTITVVPGKDVQLLVRNDADLRLRVEPGMLKAPITCGQTVGTVTVKCDNVERSRVPIVAAGRTRLRQWGAIKRLSLPDEVQNGLLFVFVGVLMFGTAAKIAGARWYSISQSQRRPHR